MDVRTIRIIKASSPDRDDLLPKRLVELEKAGFEILFDDIRPDPNWFWTAGSIKHRSDALNKALIEDESDAIMWARGGYGASDLLELIPWPQLANLKPKPVIGFSDVCAVQSALYTKLGRLSVHGPMPATVTWKKDGPSDVEKMIAVLKGQTSSGCISVRPLNIKSGENPQGRLFGGCLSVLTSLIGTPFIPSNLADHILYFEDIGENPGRIIRMLNQWQQSGLLRGVNALVLGSLSDLGGEIPDSSPLVLDEICRRYGLPTYASDDFGHKSKNNPIIMGALAGINANQLTWYLPKTKTLT
jgi:muramoyltetrapeptide carboxypeptidase